MSDPPLIFTKEYYRKLAKLERTHPWFTGTRRVAAELIPITLGEPTGGLRILDVGCGTGATIEWLARFAGRRRVTGLDLAPEAVYLARWSGGNVATASATHLPFDSETFDLVYCADVVQHLEASERRDTLAEFFRVLRPGGAILVRSNIATGAPDHAGDGYVDFDFRTFPEEIRRAGLKPLQSGRIALLSGLAAAFRGRRAGHGWSSKGLAIQPLTGKAALAVPVLVVAFWLEALLTKLRGKVTFSLGASSIFLAQKYVPFERA